MFITHWGRVTHICVSDLTIIGSENGLSPGRRQAIIGTNAGILLIRPLRTNFSEILIEILIFSFKKMRLKVPSVKRRPFCLGLIELMHEDLSKVGAAKVVRMKKNYSWLGPFSWSDLVQPEIEIGPFCWWGTEPVCWQKMEKILWCY